MTVNDLNNAMAYIDDAYLDLVDAPKKEIVQMKANRKLVILALAACLILGLGITAYASGLIPSLIAKLTNNYVLEPVTQEIQEERPDYAQWLESQQETWDMMEEIGQQAEQKNETVSADGIAEITLLESYYDGEKVSLAGKLTTLQTAVNFDFDENHEAFSKLCNARDFTPGDGYMYCSTPEETARAEQEYAKNGKVGYITYDTYIRDTILINGEEYGPFSGGMDESGNFSIAPYADGIGLMELSEACRNQPFVDVTLRVRRIAVCHWFAGGKYSSCAGEINDVPVTFRIENIH